ncbi:hypothetical protein WR25_02184 [Diploscapter pachys]|uniref:Uncharacterized protein n=1 Tax=Diploscapter pachys TaxID=2018661 RepID=A0A2A2KQP5_9BILA|nr:hypothetical protein WR25_02184 [Diploscapter pachys]
MTFWNPNNPPPYAQQLQTTTPNASIDRVIFQIEYLSGQINVVSGKISNAAQVIGERGAETVRKIGEDFNNNTIQNVDRMLDIVRQKTHDWPIVPLIVVAITGLVLIAIGSLFLSSKAYLKYTEYKTHKQIELAAEDIENLGNE